jgi:RimJ/RimL family protein N-acetyltransferase
MIELRIVGTVAKLGYVLARAFWNQDLMTEAVACVRDWSRSAGIARLSAICDVENVRSARG